MWMDHFQLIFHLAKPFELDCLPLGLAADEDDTFSRSNLAARLREETEQVYSNEVQELENNSTGPFENPRVRLSKSIASGVVHDLTAFSSTNDLIPLTFATLNDEKSRRFVWLDNISLMVRFNPLSFYNDWTRFIVIFYQTMGFTLSNIWRLPTFIYFNYSGRPIIICCIENTMNQSNSMYANRRSFNCLRYFDDRCGVTFICVGAIIRTVWANWNRQVMECCSVF